MENLDAWLSQPTRVSKPLPSRARAHGKSAALVAAHRYEAAGIPSFVWASTRPEQAERLARLAPREAAELQLDAAAVLYGARSRVDLGLQVTSVSIDELGTRVVTLEQSLNGIPVFRGQLRALLDASNALVAVSGLVASGTRPGRRRARGPLPVQRGRGRLHRPRGSDR